MWSFFKRIELFTFLMTMLRASSTVLVLNLFCIAILYLHKFSVAAVRNKEIYFRQFGFLESCLSSSKALHMKIIQGCELNLRAVFAL